MSAINGVQKKKKNKKKDRYLSSRMPVCFWTNNDENVILFVYFDCLFIFLTDAVMLFTLEIPYNRILGLWYLFEIQNKLLLYVEG